ncbi:unnamed protein product, partial [Effrenium voratum]
MAGSSAYVDLTVEEDVPLSVENIQVIAYGQDFEYKGKGKHSSLVSKRGKGHQVMGGLLKRAYPNATHQTLDVRGMWGNDPDQAGGRRYGNPAEDAETFNELWEQPDAEGLVRYVIAMVICWQRFSEGGSKGGIARHLLPLRSRLPFWLESLRWPRMVARGFHKQRLQAIANGIMADAGTGQPHEATENMASWLTLWVVVVKARLSKLAPALAYCFEALDVDMQGSMALPGFVPPWKKLLSDEITAVYEEVAEHRYVALRNAILADSFDANTFDAAAVNLLGNLLSLPTLFEEDKGGQIAKTLLQSFDAMLAGYESKVQAEGVAMEVPAPVPWLATVALDFASPLSVEEHEMMIAKMLSVYENEAKKAMAMIDAFQQSSVPVIESADYTTLSGDFLTLSSHPPSDHRLTTDSKVLTVIHLDFTTPQAARNALILPKLIATVTNIIKPKGADQSVVLAIMPSRSQNQLQWDFAQHGRLFFYGTSASCKSNHFVRYSELARTGLAPAAPVVSNAEMVAVTPSAADSEQVDSMRVNAATRSAQKGPGGGKLQQAATEGLPFELKSDKDLMEVSTSTADTEDSNSKLKKGTFYMIAKDLLKATAAQKPLLIVNRDLKLEAGKPVKLTRDSQKKMSLALSARAMHWQLRPDDDDGPAQSVEELSASDGPVKRPAEVAKKNDRFWHYCRDRKTGDLAALANPLQCELACKAIECDDISALSPTPRSVVDEAGRSGSSFVEFVAYLARLALDSRPKFILVECVANLAKLRKAVQEQGTVVVSEKLKSLGYQGKWQVLNSKHFGVAQNRTRAWGIFAKLSSCSAQKVEDAWKLISRCHVMPEPLIIVLERCNVAKMAGQAVQKGAKGAKSSKWKQEHEQFREQKQIEKHELEGLALREKLLTLKLTDREVDVSLLKLAVFNRKKPLRQQAAVVGSVGMGEEELAMVNLRDHLSVSEAQELCGNAFTGNIVIAALVAILLQMDDMDLVQVYDNFLRQAKLE